MFSNKKYLSGLLIAGLVAFSGVAAAEKPNMMKMAEKFSPELLEKLNELSPETKSTLMGRMGQHTRMSETATMRQVMMEVMVDYQAVAAAIATDNPEAAAEAAHRIVDHRLPVGGMLAYLPLDKVTDEDLKVLPTFGGAVEGGMKKVAEAAKKGDMTTAALALGEVTAGCVACHKHFRGQPGVSSRIKQTKN